MGVDTHGIEALRNSAENKPGDKPEHSFIKTLNGWLFQKIGRKVERITVSSTVDDFSFLQDSTEHYRIRVTYTDSVKDDIVSAERTV